jgi:hypothetical protein
MTYRSKTPQHRIAVIGAALMAIATDLQAATSGSKSITCFDVDKDNTNGKSNVSNGASCMAAASSMTALTTAQANTDIAVGCAAKKARASKFNGLGSSANGTCIGIDGAGSASAPAVNTATCIGSGEALGVANDEAGVDFGASCEGMAPMALMSAAAKKASGSARCQVWSYYMVGWWSLGGELTEILATGWNQVSPGSPHGRRWRILKSATSFQLNTKTQILGI